jgi:predicted DNA-binding transcriptional regulator AlpA
MATLLRAKQVAKKRGRSISRLYADIAEGRFPKGVKLGTKMVVWDLTKRGKLNKGVRYDP